jgi:hypothetical protein
MLGTGHDKTWSIIFILLAAFCSCSDKTPNPDKYFSVSIINDGPRGGAYTDLSGQQLQFRSFRPVLFSDTTVSIKVEIVFTNDTITFFAGTDTAFNARIFLLPATLSPDSQYESKSHQNGVTPELESFLNTGISETATFTVNLAPQEKYSFNVGLVFNGSSLPKGIIRAGLFINGQSHHIPLVHSNTVQTNKTDLNQKDLVFGIGFSSPQSHTVIPCGQITFKGY